MSELQGVRQFLHGIPGWENADFEALSGGLSNVTWKVTAGTRVGVLKLDSDERRAPLNSRCDEASVQSSAAQAGLAAPVILADEGYYFSTFLEGDVWSHGDLLRADRLVELGEALQRLHSLPLTGRTFAAATAANHYARSNVHLDKGIVKRCVSIVDRVGLPHNMCCCHNDLVVANIVSCPTPKFLDWEYAADNDPLFDLATVAEHHDLPESLAECLLNAYFAADAARWLPQFEQQRLLYAALRCLWLGARLDATDTELERVQRRVVTIDS